MVQDKELTALAEVEGQINAVFEAMHKNLDTAMHLETIDTSYKAFSATDEHLNSMESTLQELFQAEKATLARVEQVNNDANAHVGQVKAYVLKEVSDAMRDHMLELYKHLAPTVEMAATWIGDRETTGKQNQPVRRVESGYFSRLANQAGSAMQDLYNEHIGNTRSVDVVQDSRQ